MTRVRADDFDCTIITPYPGSPYFDRASEISPGTWVYQAKSGDKQYQAAMEYAVHAEYYKGRPAAMVR